MPTMINEKLEFPTEANPIKLDFDVDSRDATIREGKARAIVLTKENPGQALFLIVDWFHKAMYLTPRLGQIRGFEEVMAAFLNGKILKDATKPPTT